MNSDKERSSFSFVQTSEQTKICSDDSNQTLKVNALAKLFATVMSERTSKHQIANKELEIKIYYGSRFNSKLLAALYVFPNKNDSHGMPKFFMKSNVQPIPVTFKPSKETVIKQC